MRSRLAKALLGIVVVAQPLGLGSGAPVARAQGGPLTGTGLQAQYFDTKNFSDLKITRIDPTVDFDFGASSPDPSVNVDTFSIRWTGAIRADATANFTFYTLSDDGVRLWVNGVQVINNYTVHTATENFGTIGLAAGKVYEIRLEYFEQTGPAIIRLSWSRPGSEKAVIPQTALFPGVTSRSGARARTDDVGGERNSARSRPAGRGLCVDRRATRQTRHGLPGLSVLPNHDAGRLLQRLG